MFKKKQFGGLGKSLLAVALLALFVGLAAAPASAQNATVRIVHGIPGLGLGLDPDLPVDILVNDAICLESGFTFGEVAGPLTIPGGLYNVKISVANTLTPCSEDAVINADVPILEGESVSIVAHLDESGGLTASKFVNDLSFPADGGARLIAHHLAAAPLVDLILRASFLGGQPIVVSDVANGAQAAAEVAATSFNIGVAPAGSPTAIFVRSVLLKPNVTYLVYAVGSLEDGTFTIIVHPVGGLDGLTIRF